MGILEELNKINAIRSEKHYGTVLKEWSLPEWGNAVAGEVGEMCNIIKKMHRGDFKKSQKLTEQAKAEMGKEAADIVIYLDLLCQREGLFLGDLIKQKFNETSTKIGSSYLIAT